MNQRSRITIVWLLLAATLSVDIVMLSRSRLIEFSLYNFLLYFALITGQLSVVCIWSALRPTVSWWSRVAPVIATLLCAATMRLFGSEFGALRFLPFFGLQVAMLLALLWVFRRSKYWHRRSGIRTEWQFSIAQLLFVMLIVALLSISLRYSDILNDEPTVNLLFLANSALLSLGATFLWSLRLHWLLRLASVTGIAIAISGAFIFQNEGTYLVYFFGIHFLVQAAVLCIWLAWGEILPLKTDADEAAAPVGNP